MKKQNNFDLNKYQLLYIKTVPKLDLKKTQKSITIYKRCAETGLKKDPTYSFSPNKCLK